MASKVAIVGRPNVGKSTLLNRLAGKKLAIVHDRPGVTRDRREVTARLGDLDLILIDTAGYDDAATSGVEADMRAQTEAAAADADVIVFVIDARVGVTPVDESFAALLRRSGKPVVLVANKCESSAGDAGVAEAYGLGLGEPAPISAEHAEGMSDLYEALSAAIEAAGAGEEGDGGEEGDPPVRLAIVGRPNAGKSTLINALIGDERLITGPEPGVTRDAIAVRWRWRDVEVRLHDTAGMRKRAKVEDAVERLSVADTLRAIRFAEVVVLVLDAANAFEKQDLQIADLVLREGRALVFAATKWDLVDDRQAALADLRERAGRLIPQAPGAPLLPVSGVTGRGLDKIMPAVMALRENWSAKVKTRDLNDWLREAVARHPPPAVQGRRIKPRYIAQTKSRPPPFVLMCSRAAHMPDSYKRYLVSGI
ncbi:MAG: ribosome biogenesis GTPase Der, partial [Caulobacterales bacterium]|nr:ribosome biogenesis GTPase Der [Caulobacterales bacterium]